MKIVFTVLFFYTVLLLTAQESKFDPDKKYPSDSLQMWTRSIMKSISEKHPGFYRYTTKERFDDLIDSTAKTIIRPLTELEYYRKMKPLFAQTGCLHTGISLSENYISYLEKTATMLPLEVFTDSDRKVFITKNQDPFQTIPVGAELIAINGKPVADILKTLLNAIPSDGYNQTEKILLLNHRFAFWYQTIIEAGEQYSVKVSENGNNRVYELKGVSKETFTAAGSRENKYAKALEFEVINGAGLLKIHTFAKTPIKAQGQDFRKFIKGVFKRVEKEGIDSLILDLRYNSGGTDGNAAFLASFFFDAPFRYWSSIEVTEALAGEIKGMKRLFYKKPKKVNGTYQWRKTWMTSEFDYYQVQQPAKNNYRGRTYILTNGLCMSSCSDFVAILSDNKKAIVIGQETGGAYQGNTSGMMPEVTIPTGLRISIPLQKYTNAVDPGRNVGRGTIPDHEVVPTFSDWINKKDIEMEYVLQLLKVK